MTTQNFQNLTDEQLVAQFQSTRNNRLFGEIYNRYYQKVYHTCLGIVKDRDVASDLVQDVMIKVMDSLPKLQNGFLLGLWINRIAKNHSIDFCKERNSKAIVPADEQFDLVDETIDMEVLEAKEKIFEGLEHAFNDLKEEDRLFLSLKYYDNYSVEDLQKQYNLSKSAVKMRLARARKRVERLCKKEQLNELYL